MSGMLQRAPTESDLERLYFELAQVGATSVGRKRRWPYRAASVEDLLVLAAEMVRYDPRLLSILVQFLLARFQTLNPLTIRLRMRAMRCPQALLVVVSFCREATTEPELRHFVDYVCAGWSRVEPPERFFLDAELPGSRMAARKLGRNLAPYARWGFLGSERPIVDARTKRTVGRYDARTRHRILEDLLGQRGELTLADYLDAVDHAISRQQALTDLRAFPGLQTRGHGRGAKWRLAAPNPAPICARRR